MIGSTPRGSYVDRDRLLYGGDEIEYCDTCERREDRCKCVVCDTCGEYRRRNTECKGCEVEE